MLDQELNFVFELQAKINAKDKDYFMPIIKGRLLIYLNAYIDFVNDKSKILLIYLQTDKNLFIDKEKEFSYGDLWNLIMFLNSARRLIDDKNDIKEEYFNKYQKFSSIKKLEKWKNLVNYADKELNLNGIQNLHDFLQFIIALFKVEEIRAQYLKEIFLKNFDEKTIGDESIEAKEKLFKRSKSLKKQKNYFNQIGY